MTLLPQRGPPVGATARQQEGPACALPEPGGEERRLRERRHDEFVDVLRVDQQRIDGQLVGRLRQAHHDPVVTPHRLDRDVVTVHELPLDRHGPRRVDRRAERREDAHPPIADLVAETLDHHRAIVGDGARALRLLVEVLHEVGRRERIERVVLHEPFDRSLAHRTLGGLDQCPRIRIRHVMGLTRHVTRVGGAEIADLADERAERAAQLERAARAVAVPERHLAGLPGRRATRDPLERDVLDPPRRRAEHERLARPRLVDHLLVELADAGAVGQEHPEQAPVGDRAARGDRKPLRPVAGPDRVVDTIPHDPRAQLGELLARISPRQQVEHVVQQVVGDLGEVRAAAHDRRHLVDRALVDGRRVRDDLLREHVEWVAQEPARLDLAVEHPPGDDGRLEQVAAMLREDRTPRRLAHLVAGTTDPLHAAADCPGRLDLDDEIDRPHVDPELQRRGRDDRPQLAAFELVLDDDALLAGQRPVVGLHEFLDHRAGLGVDDAWHPFVDGQLVELRCQAFGGAASVAEDDRRPIREDALEDLGVDAGPDRRARLAHARARDRRRRIVCRSAERRHVLDRNHDLDLHVLADPRIDDPDRPLRTGLTVGSGRFVPTEELGDLLEWALCRRQTDPLRRPFGHFLESFERQREVRTALRRRHRVDLVDDHGFDTDERFGCLRGEHQVQRLRRGDQQVGRSPDQLLAVVRRCVAGAHPDLGCDERLTQPFGGEFDALQRCAQVLLDVEGQCPQRGDVEHPSAMSALLGSGCRGQPVDRGQERRERLPRPGGCADQRVFAGGDVWPAVDLRWRRRRER